MSWNLDKITKKLDKIWQKIGRLGVTRGPFHPGEGSVGWVGTGMGWGWDMDALRMG